MGSTMMHLICVATTSGIPIFSRKRGECENLPFAAIGALNGIHTFFKSKGARMKTINMTDGTILKYRDYNNEITLIGIMRGVTDKTMGILMDHVYDAMVSCVGLNELKQIQNLERLKRELKLHCCPLIDKLMDIADNEFIPYTDCMMVSEGKEILSKLNEFSDLVESSFCFVMIHNKIVAGTEGWWDLDAVDRKVLTTILTSNNNVRTDIPVFLPKKSPNIAYRLASVRITANVLMCVLCGAQPSYSAIEAMAKNVWKGDYSILKEAELCYPKNFPLSLQVEPCIFAIVLINKPQSKCIISKNLHKASKNSSTGAHRLQILQTFFHRTDIAVSKPINRDKLEAYMVMDYHKCHSLIQEEHFILILYDGSIPTHTIRLITKKTLNLILSEKDIVW